MRSWLPTVAIIGVVVIVVFYLGRARRSPNPTQAEAQPTPLATTIEPAGTQPLAAPPVAAMTNRIATANLVAIQKNNPVSTAPASSPASPTIFLPEPAVPIEDLPKLSQSIVLENLRLAFRQYQNHLGGNNPVGTNEEITRALNGENPKQVRFLRIEDGMRANAKGELVDAWGTPYFFHQLSGTEMEIHSAGQDKKMWTSDDLVIK